jgi:hypothetical protein
VAEKGTAPRTICSEKADVRERIRAEFEEKTRGHVYRLLATELSATLPGR